MPKMTLEEEFLKSKTSGKETFEIKHGVKLKKVPPSAKLKDIKTLLQGVKVKNVLFQHGGMALVTLASEEAVQTALKKNGQEIKNHKIIVRPLNEPTEKKKSGKETTTLKRQFFPTVAKEKLIEDIEELGRLYIRNLPFECTEKELDEMFSPFGLLTEVHLPFDLGLKRNRGFAFVTFMHPKDAVKAFKKLDKTEFHKRKIHILPARDSNAPDPVEEAEEEGKSRNFTDDSSYKKAKLAELRKNAGRASHTWNPLFVNPSAVAEVQAAEIGVAKEALLDSGTRGSAAVRLAQVELSLLTEVEAFLQRHHVHVEELKRKEGQGGSETVVERSRSTFLIKNLPAFTTKDDLEPLLTPHGELEKLAVSPKGVIALVEYKQSLQARRAFAHMAFAQFKDSLLKVEWAPLRPRKRLSESEEEEEEEEQPTKRRKKEDDEDTAAKEDKKKTKKKKKEPEVKEEVNSKPNVILVRNIPFQANRRELEELFQPFGNLERVRLPKKAGGGIRGFAFIEYADKEGAEALMGADKKLHLYGRRLRFELALAETDLSQKRAAAFESIVSGEDAQIRERRKKKITGLGD